MCYDVFEEILTNIHYNLLSFIIINCDNAIFQDKAAELFCFGWVQNNTMMTPVNEGETLVGEARCRTNAGSEMKAFLSSLAAGEGKKKKKKHIVFKDYDDTLIRLHFSHFKIVSPGRNTCFRDEPHQCIF